MNLTAWINGNDSKICVYIYICILYSILYRHKRSLKWQKARVCNPIFPPWCEGIALGQLWSLADEGCWQSREAARDTPFWELQNQSLSCLYVSLQKGVSRASSFQTSACCRRLSTKRSLDTTGVVSAVRLGNNSIHPFIPQERKSYISQRLKAI